MKANVMIEPIEPITFNDISKDGLEELFKFEQYQLLKAIENDNVRYVLIQYCKIGYGYENMCVIKDKKIEGLINSNNKEELKKIILQ